MLVIVVLVLVVGGNYARQLKVGDTEAGAAVLFADHPYNKAFRFFNQNFVGATQLVIIVEGSEKGAVKNYETLQTMEDFQRYMEIEGGAGGTLTFVNMIKRVFRMFHEGNPKWEILPKKPRHLGQIGSLIRNNSARGELDQWIEYDWTNATITCFYKDYDNELIKRSIAKAKEFIEANNSETVKFRLAGGLLGILAAVNEEVEYSYWVSLIVVFSAVLLLCVLTFRSVMAGLILIIPLTVSQILSEVFMLMKGIDLNINSLPVAAIAVGIGIDYGIYLLARISEEYEKSGDYRKANRRAVETTGKAIIFTATTLIAGVIFWVFADIKFQAEMGLLLGLLMFLNMFDALVLIPSLVTIFKPKFVAKRKV
jgi:predicted RND superfamily exporter protein